MTIYESELMKIDCSTKKRKHFVSCGNNKQNAFSLLDVLNNPTLLWFQYNTSGSSLSTGKIHKIYAVIIGGKDVSFMAVHHGGKVGKAGKTLASKKSSKKAKSNAGKTLADHKAAKH